ncbi:MAG: DoxX family protein [Nannocystis sp.]|nr:MauE/DoxX family redox-associated membrane protein [Nannocystis sp.]MBA3546106.1 DoxX family protein [Nannocystis sp.]
MSSQPSLWRRAAWPARLVLAGVFLAAAAPKLADPAGFAAAIANYRAFPDALVNLVATIVPALELVGALALLSPWRRGGALLLGALLLGFTALLATSLARGLDVSCGCFGGADVTNAAETAGDPVRPLHLLRNLGLLALVALSLAEPRTATAAPATNVR